MVVRTIDYGGVKIEYYIGSLLQNKYQNNLQMGKEVKCLKNEATEIL